MFSGLKLDVENEEATEKAYKSCFARSVVVNSKFHEVRASALQTTRRQVVQPPVETVPVPDKRQRDVAVETLSLVDKNQDNTAKSARNSFRKDSVDSVPDFSMENLFLKSQLETLQWQLKQTEESRQMYQAVMRQVVTFLERAHRSLEHLGTKLNNGKQSVVRSLSHHEMSTNSEEPLADTPTPPENCSDYAAFRDFTWRRCKKQQASPEEIPPEKLSQEAFRLLRTAESLLNTQEPDLAHLRTTAFNCSSSPTPSTTAQYKNTVDKPFQRPPFAASSPQLAGSERSFSRKAVLRRQHALKCNSFHAETLSNESSLESQDGKVFDSRDFSVFANENSTNGSRRSSVSSQKSGGNEKFKGEKVKNEPEKSVTPPMSSVSSAEDESGFSSMNSFQEIGIPIINYEETKSKDALLRSMLHDNEYSPNSYQPAPAGIQNSTVPSFNGTKEKRPSQNDYKLWQTPDKYSHKRWSSTPIEHAVAEGKQPLKVLWV